MGIHSGPVSGLVDVDGRSNIAGAGINVAQRVMDCGDAGHILLSRHVAEDLEQYRQWRPYLHDLGECEVKHGVRVHIVNFYTDDLGNPQAPEKFKQPIASNFSRRNKSALIGASVVAAAALGVGFWFFLHHLAPKSANQAIPPAIPSRISGGAATEESV